MKLRRNLRENEAVSTLDHGALFAVSVWSPKSPQVLDLWEVPTFLWFWPSSHWEPPAIFANSPTVFVFQSQNHKNHKEWWVFIWNQGNQRNWRCLLWKLCEQASEDVWKLEALNSSKVSYWNELFPVPGRSGSLGSPWCEHKPPWWDGEEMHLPSPNQPTLLRTQCQWKLFSSNKIVSFQRSPFPHSAPPVAVA